MTLNAPPRPPSTERLLAVARLVLGPREHAVVLAEARAVVADERARLAAGGQPTGIDDLAQELVKRLDRFADPGGAALVRVINATGVILHTNLGRAPWPAAATEAARNAAVGYQLLELDRRTGRRGARFRAAEEHLIALTGAEDALVTNNNAAAVGLAVHLAGRAGVAVARGELVEIGGGVRIPEIVRRAGGRLIEVGTTNKTRADDFEEPLATGRAVMVLRVHPSNFRLEGFTESPDPGELVALVHRHGALVVDDLGSGALMDTSRYGLAHEPMPSERLAGGADLVTFSGDKLVGGPQAGLIAGHATLVARIRKDPLARATRPDKVTLAALAATLGLYRAGVAEREIPVWRMIAAGANGLRRRAELIAASVQVEVVSLRSTVGGGSLPGETLPSWGLGLPSPGPDRLVSALRLGEPCVIARIEGDRVVLDLRTVEPEADHALGQAVGRAIAGG